MTQKSRKLDIKLLKKLSIAQMQTDMSINILVDHTRWAYCLSFKAFSNYWAGSIFAVHKL